MSVFSWMVFIIALLVIMITELMTGLTVPFSLLHYCSTVIFKGALSICENCYVANA